MKVGGGPARAELTNNINYVEATIEIYDVMGVASKTPSKLKMLRSGHHLTLRKSVQMHYPLNRRNEEQDCLSTFVLPRNFTVGEVFDFSEHAGQRKNAAESNECADGPGNFGLLKLCFNLLIRIHLASL
jgi:hypothetical protein